VDVLQQAAAPGEVFGVFDLEVESRQHAVGTFLSLSNGLQRGQEEERQPEQQVDGQQHRAFEPVGLAIKGDQRGDQRGGEQRRQLEGVEDQQQSVVKQQADKHEQRRDEQRDLDAGAQR